MTKRAEALADISMISANYGNLSLARAVHEDWFRFLGGRPGEVVFVENGSPLKDQTTLYEGVKSGWITKLLSVRPGAFDIGKHQAYIAEISALAMATRPLALLYHLDVLVSQRGHQDWVMDARTRLEDPQVFAIGGSFNAPSKAADVDEDWYLSKKISGNFALLPRSRYQEAWLRAAGDFLRSGYRQTHPLPGPERRFLMEVGLEKQLAARDWYTWVQRESADWIVFHTNLSGDALREARERFVAGEDLGPYLNAGDELVGPENTRKLKYFGHPEASLIKRLRIAFGASLAGRVARRLRGRKLPPREGEADPPTVHELTSAHRSPLDDLALVVWVDDPASLASGLSALYAALGARPRQVVALVSTQDAAVDVAWGAHLDGHTDKLVVSRSLAPRSGPSLASMTDHGVFAHAHCPNYLLARASSLASRAGWIARVVQEGAVKGLALPEGASLDHAEVALRRRRDLLGEIEARSHAIAVLGAGVPGEPAPLEVQARLGAA